ncbi:MAG: Arginine utilization regulatory protein RocR [Firmicutes bacterium]|nr:Arginine utilization regulatory protein RocR [Bacillota bacterium]MDI6705151.1 sigma 54-interacting transcriptional regulator [Bacillota bacterium]
MLEQLSSENFKEFLDYVDSGIQVVDSRGRIVYCNKHVAYLDDVNRERAIGRHILEIYPSLDHDTSTILKVLETGQPIIDNQQTFINYKGKKITTINTTLPIKVKGRIKGAVEISRDITQVKKLSERIVDLEAELVGDGSRSIKDKKNGNKAVYTFMDIVGQNRQILELKSLAFKASQTSSPIMVYGETGTGKELFVHAVHNASSRRKKPFIAQNCAALPATLLEGILFGTVKGSFTGADNRPGLFELADGGTLFLDEIDSMPVELQAKLLRVLQDGCVRRIGDLDTVYVDVRIIAATSKNPLDAVKARHLREDLYYRLNVVSLRVPPLRERKDDIPLLTDHFIQVYNRTMDKGIREIEPKVRDMFYAYSWPGNVRELQHVIEGAMNIIEGDTLGAADLPHGFNEYFKSDIAMKDRHLSLKDTLEQVEKEMIYNALGTCDMNITKAAEKLDIPRQTLQYKMAKYGIK